MPSLKALNPKEAVRAMLHGKILKNAAGNTYFWDELLNCFFTRDKESGKRYAINQFYGLSTETK